jgi:hypothetical protein
MRRTPDAVVHNDSHSQGRGRLQRVGDDGHRLPRNRARVIVRSCSWWV